MAERRRGSEGESVPYIERTYCRSTLYRTKTSSDIFIDGRRARARPGDGESDGKKRVEERD